MFIEFGHWMQKLQHFELDLKLCEAFFESLGIEGFTRRDARGSARGGARRGPQRAKLTTN